MKNFFSLLFIVSLTLVTMHSCSKDDNRSGNSLDGTLWSCDDEVTVFEPNYFTRYIEFVDDKTVKIWDTDTGNAYTGTYKINGSGVTFYNLNDAYWNRFYIDGTFTSNSLTVSFSYDAEYTTGPYHETYIKE